MAAQQYTPDRRPIASRERKISKVVAHVLAVRGVSPNTISTAGMISGVAAGLVLAATTLPGWQRPAFVAAAVLMQLRLLANMLDGMVAVECQKASPVGELYNEVPDRVSDTAAFVGAGYALGSHAVLGFVAALLALFIAYLRAEGKVAGAHQEFCGPMAKPQRVFVLTLVALYCGLAPHGWQPTLAWPPQMGLMGIGLAIIIAGELWTAARRILRIVRALKETAP
ncbi:MAG: CDP-alcohol phosphatidyltransferase family protein [Thermoguttaceae bacterium]